MNWWQYAIFIIVVFMVFASGFFYMTDEKNWDAGTPNYKEVGK